VKRLEDRHGQRLLEIKKMRSTAKSSRRQVKSDWD
jgi:hypothetical protein